MGFNCFGKPIDDIRLSDRQLTADDSFLDSSGHFKWPKDNGFDPNANIAESGPKVPIELPKGKVFSRYGNNGGHLMSDKGVPYDLLGLPYKKELKEYHEYVLNKNTKLEECGYIAPVFNSSGGVLQYYVKNGIEDLLQKDILSEDTSWIKKIK